MWRRERDYSVHPCTPPLRAHRFDARRCSIIRFASATSSKRLFQSEPTSTLLCSPTEGPTAPSLGSGGERGIRTLDGLLTHTPLAGVRLRPLGHLSAAKTSTSNRRVVRVAPIGLRVIPHVHVLHPFGAIRSALDLMFKFAPGEFVDHSAISPALDLPTSFQSRAHTPRCAYSHSMASPLRGAVCPVAR